MARHFDLPHRREVAHCSGHVILPDIDAWQERVQLLATCATCTRKPCDQTGPSGTFPNANRLFFVEAALFPSEQEALAGLLGRTKRRAASTGECAGHERQFITL